jgi:hypothetical protein
MTRLPPISNNRAKYWIILFNYVKIIIESIVFAHPLPRGASLPLVQGKRPIAKAKRIIAGVKPPITYVKTVIANAKPPISGVKTAIAYLKPRIPGPQKAGELYNTHEGEADVQ